MTNFFDQNGEGNMIVKRKKNIFMMLLLVFALFASGLQASPAFAAQQIATGTISVEGSQETGTLLSKTPLTYQQNETAFDALLGAVNNKAHVQNDPNLGTYIDEIMGLKAEGTNYWAFYVNGIYSPVGANSYTVGDGDQLSFHYVDWTKPADSVTLKVIGNNNQVLEDYTGYKSVQITGQPTALQLLQVTLGKDKVALIDTKYGPMITNIAGTAAQGNSYWGFYVNDQYMSVGADSYQLKPNDQVTFKYETYTPTGGTDTNGNSNSSTDSNTNNPSPSNEGIPEEQLQKSIDSASGFILGNNLDEWSAVALNKAGKTVPSSYLENVSQDIVSRTGKFHFITDPERYILGILAAGGDPRNISGYNLVESIYNGDVSSQGINGVIYALIALDSGNFNVPSSAVWTREKLINEIINDQQSDGHWSLSTKGDSSDPDITAMALTALAPYKDQAGVKERIDLGIQYLSKTYLNSKVNSQTVAQIIISLSSLGKYDTSSPLFNKNGNSIMKNLLSFQNNDGGFALNGGESSDVMATQQGLLALDAYRLYKTGQGSLYQLPVSPQSQKTDTIREVNNPQGKTLPNTATDSANLVLAGFVLILFGLVFIYFNRTKKS